MGTGRAAGLCMFLRYEREIDCCLCVCVFVRGAGVQITCRKCVTIQIDMFCFVSVYLLTESLGNKISLLYIHPNVVPYLGLFSCVLQCKQHNIKLYLLFIACFYS